MIIGHDFLEELVIVMNFKDHTVTWDTDTIPMKDTDAWTLSSVEALIEKRSEMNILKLPKF
jgi:hypothetical protein